MLIQYKYELIAFVANQATILDNNNLRCSLLRLRDILGNEIDKILKELENDDFLIISNNYLEIDIAEWGKFFTEQLNILFHKNKFLIISEFNNKNLIINFNINNVKKVFKIILNDKVDNEIDDKIYFYNPLNASNGVYWLDLVNDINTFYLFCEYLNNCADSLNKRVYNKFKNLDGLSDQIISEIFNISIKKYFEMLGFKSIELNEEQERFIYKLFRNKDIDIKAIKIDSDILCIINLDRKFEFVVLKGMHLINSEKINAIVSKFKKSLNEKISEYRKITLSKDNKILDNNIKLGTKALAIFSPISAIIGIATLFNVQIVYDELFRFLAIVIIFILLVLQVYIIKVVIAPLIKLNKFNWELEE